jgi:hypothetical protein
MLEPTPGTDGIRELRAFLKLALRRFGLRCVRVQECSDDPKNAASANLPV